MKKCVLFYIAISLLSSHVHCDEYLNKQELSTDEALWVRRIAEYWKDGDYAIVKSQVRDFINKHPSSVLQDYFEGILADLYLQDHDTEQALVHYEKVKDPEIVERIILNKMQCYYELNKYEDLVSAGTPYLTTSNEEFQARQDEFIFLMGEGFFRQSIEAKDDARQTLALKAKNFYEKLENTSYEKPSSFALAEIHALLGASEQAALLYTELADKYPDMSDDLLFQAANMQAQFDPDQASQTFEKLIKSGGKHLHESMFNQLILLFEKGEHEAVLTKFNDVSAHVPYEFLPTFHYIVGKSFYALDQQKQALEAFDKYLENAQNPDAYLNSVLLTYMSAAYHSEDLNRFEKGYELFTTNFPSDAEHARALFMHAMLLKQDKQMERALAKLDLIVDEHPTFNEQENFLFEYGHIAYELQNWQVAYNSLQTYLDGFLDSDRAAYAWKLFFGTALHLYSASNEAETPFYTQTNFYDDLQNALENKAHFSNEEFRRYQLLYSKISFELGYYAEAKHELNDYITGLSAEDRSEEMQKGLAEAHFVAALCHQSDGNNHLAICSHFKQAIALDPQTYNTPDLHLQLFNSNLALAQDEKDPAPEFFDQAAENLFTAMQSKGHNVRTENKLWLAGYYYTQIKSALDRRWKDGSGFASREEDALHRALDIYNTALLAKKNEIVTFNLGNIAVEPEVLKFAELLKINDQPKQSLKVLQQLVKQQRQNASLDWAFKAQSFFELAQTYRTMGKNIESLKTFQELQNLKLPASYYTIAAKLYEAEIQFSLLADQHKHETNEMMLNVLNHFKELQIQKNLVSEPLHLEAALEYARIRAGLASPEIRDTKYLFFLKRMKEDFNAKECDASIAYHVALKKSPEKSALFSAYMSFVDAEILVTEARLLKTAENFVEMEELSVQALSLLDDVKTSEVLNQSLHEHVMRSISSINELNSYATK